VPSAEDNAKWLGMLDIIDWQLKGGLAFQLFSDIQLLSTGSPLDWHCLTKMNQETLPRKIQIVHRLGMPPTCQLCESTNQPILCFDSFHHFFYLSSSVFSIQHCSQFPFSFPHIASLLCYFQLLPSYHHSKFLKDPLHFTQAVGIALEVIQISCGIAY